MLFHHSRTDRLGGNGAWQHTPLEDHRGNEATAKVKPATGRGVTRVTGHGDNQQALAIRVPVSVTASLLGPRPFPRQARGFYRHLSPPNWEFFTVWMLYANEVNPGESLFSRTLGQRHRYHASLITVSRVLAAVSWCHMGEKHANATGEEVLQLRGEKNSFENMPEIRELTEQKSSGLPRKAF